MTKSDLRTSGGYVLVLVGTIFVASLVWYVWQLPDLSLSSATGKDDGVKERLAAPQKMPWKEWPKPELALILTGEQHGFFEPCGCTSNQLGGMTRCADLVKRMGDADWSVRGVDVGGLSRRTGAQAGIKLHTTLNALDLLGYVGVGLGAEELKLGVDGLLDVQMQMMNAKTSVKFISANVKLLDGALEEFPIRSHLAEVDGLKIGVTSVLSEALQREVFPLGDAEWTEPKSALKAVLTEFTDQEVDLRILLSQSTVEESIEFAKEFPQFQIIVTARGVGDPDPNAAPQKVGDTLIIETGRQGKHVGVLGVYRGETGLTFRYKLVSLEEHDFEDSPVMVDLMQKYQTRLKDEKIVLVDGISAPHPSQSKFVGADQCGECHTKAYEIWQGTPHAHALESLDPVNKRKGHERLNGVNRTFDPECLSCHVTGWNPQEYTRFRSGFLNEEFAANDEEKKLHQLLAGNQCENCHGPGSRHVEMVEAGELNPGQSVRVTLEQSEKVMCVKCHDGDNSPDFEFDEFWKKVEHSGLD